MYNFLVIVTLVGGKHDGKHFGYGSFFCCFVHKSVNLHTKYIIYIVYMGKKQTVNYYNINVSRALTATGQEAGYAQLRFKTGAWLKRDGE